MQAQAVLKDVGLPNSYTLTKHMAEGLVADMHAAGVLPSAIVRPSIVSCIARAPAPGYFGNSAGLTSIVLVYASGERQLNIDSASSAWHVAVDRIKSPAKALPATMCGLTQAAAMHTHLLLGASIGLLQLVLANGVSVGTQKHRWH